jgi:tetratricopeptide (TPR) repeat protein
LAFCVLLFAGLAAAADLDQCRKLFLSGDYTNSIRAAEGAIRDQVRDEEWPLLLMQSLLAVGRYPEAESALTDALARYRYSIRLRVLGFDVLNANGNPDRARALLEEINNFGSLNTRGYEVPVVVALGKAALLLGAEPALVLENFYDQAKRTDPKFRDAYLASGDLALDKGDFALAAKIYGETLKKFPEDADSHFGLARAFQPSDRGEMLKELEAALSHNANHVPSMLLLADHAIDAEDDALVQKMLDRALSVNPWQPEAWAYRAALAHLRNDTNGENEAHEMGLKFWKTNPKVDHLIGKKLSQKYRFAEGSAFQRQALKFDAKYLPARIQLAQDLLRLGGEEEGWQLAEEVSQRDGYDVTAYNLVGLRETLGKFQTVTNQEFILRMSRHEAAIYGQRALDLLQRAHKRLSEKYGLTPAPPTVVEIFPEQKDFAVRTFGMPENPGFLGVCFGHVVTANSPASQTAHPANWQAVLWHEFCHVITLQLTRNRMPRWLSEGISVYEEIQENPTWGQAMTPRYREMILGDDLTPVSKLSAAFLSPKSDLHLQFAYYESSLVVDYLVQRFGFESLKQILHDLGEGTDINAAIAAHTEPIGQFEKGFGVFARERAERLAPGLDWKKFKPIDPDHGAESVADLVEKNPTNFWALTDYARKLIADKKWEQAKVPLKKLLESYPGFTGANNAYFLLAAAHRGLNETNEEREVLSKLAALDADATATFQRLMELNEAAKDWTGVAQNAQRFLAVNPLLPQPYRHLARANEELSQTEAAIQSYDTLLLLDPQDPAEVHYRLARLLRQRADPAAKRHVLQALEEAPRYRDAHRLLLELNGSAPGAKEKAEAPDAESKP